MIGRRTTIIGFTGTRRGMSEPQKARMAKALMQFSPVTFHHGDCVGADAETHHLVRKLLSGCQIHAHPCDRVKFRALLEADVYHEPKPPLDRNDDIVAAADILLAAPAGLTEQTRSGTWSTIRKARRAGKELYIIFPNGSAEKVAAADPNARWAVMYCSVGLSPDFYRSTLGGFQLAWERAGKPPGFEIYRDDSPLVDGKECCFYFSPIAAALCINSIKGNGGNFCDPPETQGMVVITKH